MATEGAHTPAPGIILCDGSLASLIACAIACEEHALSPKTTPLAHVLPLVLHPSTAPAQHAAVAHHADAFRMRVIDSKKLNLESIAPHLLEAIALANACAVARAQGATRLTWPAFACEGEVIDTTRLAMLTQVAVLAPQIETAHDASAIPVHVDLPFADLTEAQLADLAVDMAIPVRACWWWGQPTQLSDAGKERCRLERTRWANALKSVGWSPEREVAAHDSQPSPTSP